MKIIGLMLASNNMEHGKSYMDMVTACKETWIKHRHPNVEVVATWGDTYCPEITKKLNKDDWIITPQNDLYINTKEHRANLLIKTIKGMECALARWPDLDYVFRPNCGSYINTHLLYKFLKDKPRQNYFAGITGEHMGIPFISGACMLFSKDIVKLIVDHQDEINLDGWGMMDDVSMGKFLDSMNIPFSNDGQRVMADSEHQLNQLWDKDCYHHYFCHTINPRLIYQCHELFKGAAE